MLHLKHFGPLAIQNLTKLFNLSIQSAVVPSIWKQAKIIPIHKVGEPRHLRTSYRPISFLCTAIKVLKRLLLASLNLYLNLSDTQHGFGKLRLTSSALLPLAHKVATDFNIPRQPLLCTVAMSNNLSKAFDTVKRPMAVVREGCGVSDPLLVS